MKFYLLAFSVLVALSARSQQTKLLVSTEGIDSIKMGMSENQVEKIIGTPLKPIDTTAQLKDPNSDRFMCHYKGVELVVVFIKFASDGKAQTQLYSIVPTSSMEKVETKTGIKAGISENAFIDICKKNNYSYTFLGEDEKSRGYFFSDNPDVKFRYRVIIKIDNGVITALGVINMIGY